MVHHDKEGTAGFSPNCIAQGVVAKEERVLDKVEVKQVTLWA